MKTLVSCVKIHCFSDLSTTKPIPDGLSLYTTSSYIFIFITFLPRNSWENLNRFLIEIEINRDSKA